MTTRFGATCATILGLALSGLAQASPYSSMAVPGTHNGWDPTPSMVLVGGAGNVWVCTQTFSSASGEFKFAANGSWTENWGGNAAIARVPAAASAPTSYGANLSYSGLSNGNYRITFDNSTLEFTLEWAGEAPLPLPTITNLALVGDFNGWTPNANSALTNHPAPNTHLWSVSLDLETATGFQFRPNDDDANQWGAPVAATLYVPVAGASACGKSAYSLTGFALGTFRFELNASNATFSVTQTAIKLKRFEDFNDWTDPFYEVPGTYSRLGWNIQNGAVAPTSGVLGTRAAWLSPTNGSVLSPAFECGLGEILFWAAALDPAEPAQLLLQTTVDGSSNWLTRGTFAVTTAKNHSVWLDLVDRTAQARLVFDPAFASGDILVDDVEIRIPAMFRNQNFDGWPTKGIYFAGVDLYDDWFITNCIVDSLYAYQGQVARLSSTVGNYVLSPEFLGGIGPISFRTRKWSASDDAFTLQVQLSSNGASWFTATNISATSTNYQLAGMYLNDTTNKYVRFYHSSGAVRALVDDIQISVPKPRPEVVVTPGTEPPIPVADESVTLIACVEPRYGASVVSVTGYYRIAYGAFTGLPMESIGNDYYSVLDNIPAQPAGTMLRYYYTVNYAGFGADPVSSGFATNVFVSAVYTNYVGTQTFSTVTVLGNFIGTNPPPPNMMRIGRTPLWESDHHITNTCDVTVRFVADLEGYTWGATNGATVISLPATGILDAGLTNYASVAVDEPGRYRIAFNHSTGDFSLRLLYPDDSQGNYPNLLKNPGFELTTTPEGGDAVGWNGSQSWPKSIDDDYAPHSGNWCGAIYGQLYPDWTDHASLAQEVLIVPGRTYTAEAWLKGTPDWEADSMQIAIEWIDQSQDIISNDTIEVPSLTTSWVKYSSECVAPSNATKARVAFLCIGAGTNGSMHVDDVALTGVWPPPQDFTYTINPNRHTITITGYTGLGGAVDVPFSIRGNTVTSIGVGAFSNCTYVGSVTIGGGVTNIGEYAFRGCSLTDIVIPDNVARIELGAFRSCSGLTNVVIGSGVTDIGSGAFRDCHSLTAMTVSESNLYYSSADGVLFKGKTIVQCLGGKIGSYTVPSSSWSPIIPTPPRVTNILYGAFLGCNRLTNIFVTDNDYYSSVDGVLFNKSESTLIQCPGGKAGSWSIPLSTANIADSAFGGCEKLTNVSIPDSVVSIGNWAFSSCMGLTNIVVGSGVTSIGNAAFSNCTSLSAVFFGGNAPSNIGLSPFSETPATIYYLSGTVGWPTVPDLWASRPTAIWQPDANFAIRVNSPDGTTATITGYTGSGGDVSIPSNIAGRVVIGIETNAFYGCTNLTGVSIPDSITAIGNFSFSGCTSLTNVVIGNGVTSIGMEAFGGCAALTSISVNSANLSFSSLDDVVFNKTQTALILYPCGKSGSYTVPSSVDSIGNWAFSSCMGLTNIVVGSGVTSIGNAAFSNCTSLSAVFFGGNAPSNIGLSPFSETPATIYYLSGTVGWPTVPDLWASRPTAIWQPDANFAIRVNSPDGTTATITGYTGSGGDVSIPSNIAGRVVIGIETNAFYGCTNLTGVSIPDSITAIGNFSFSGCTSLTNVVIGNGVTSIGNWAFANCSHLVSVEFGSSVARIGEWAFQSCRNLNCVYFQSNAPENVGVYAFENANSSTIYYLPGTIGWPPVPDLWAGRPTAYWLPKVTAQDLGVQGGQFGFNVSWAEGQLVEVAACTNLANPDWVPLATNTLGATDYFFGDALWTNFPGRFYRIRRLP